MTLQANSKFYYLNENTTLSLGLAAGLSQGDASSDGPVSVSLDTGPAHGSLTLAANGAFAYTPVAGYVGADSFTFLVSDGASSTVATAQLTVGSSVLKLPGASFAVAAGATLDLSASGGLLANAYSSLGALHIVSVGVPAFGKVTAEPDGGFVYTGDDTIGADSFTYTVSDGASTATATATVTNVAPLLSVNDDHYALAAGASLRVAASAGLLANDYASQGVLTASLVSAPVHGQVTIAPDGGFVYTPNGVYTGLDSFKYLARDSDGGGKVATVTIAAGGAFALGGESYVESQGLSLTVAAAQGLLSNIYSAAGGLTLVSTGAAAHGALWATPDGAFTYSPNPGYFGDDSITYTVRDAAGNFASATATIAVADRAPTTDPLTYEAHGALSVGAAAGLLHATFGYSGQETVVSYDPSALHGSIVVNPDGSFVYTPHPGYVGPDSFSFVSADSFGVAVTQTASLDVVGQSPVANPDQYAVTAGRTLDVAAASGLLANDADPDGDSLAVTAHTAPAHGQIAVNSDGSFVYTPDSGYVGADSFAYTVTDSTGATASATASVNVDAFAVVCFAAGVRIATARGEIEVERLRVGDLARTASGALRPIRWLGHRRIDCRRRPCPEEAWPIRIAVGAFGPGLPRRDLHVSPRHALALGESALAPAIALVNGATIRQIEVDEIEYWHVELESHDLLIAEGLAAESYLETGGRGFFIESGFVGLDLGPDAPLADFCRPLEESGPALDGARAWLTARAEALGWRRTTGYGALRLIADGASLAPTWRGDAARFLLPPGVRELWLVCETSRPCDVGESPDQRALGVALRGLAFEDGFGPAQTLALDDERLGPGFHECEPGPHRWTGARARIDMAGLCEHGGFLRLDLAPPAPRWAPPEDEGLVSAA